jgi:hypothetical protein
VHGHSDTCKAFGDLAWNEPSDGRLDLGQSNRVEQEAGLRSESAENVPLRHETETNEHLSETCTLSLLAGEDGAELFLVDNPLLDEKLA